MSLASPGVYVDSAIQVHSIFSSPWENEDWEHMEIKEIRALSTLEFLAIYIRYIHFLLLKALIFLFGKIFNRISCIYNIAYILSAIWTTNHKYTRNINRRP